LPVRLLDAIATRMLRLPAASTGYTVTRDMRVPMRDGVQLEADLYQPPAPVGTLLARGPYERGTGMALPTARVFAARGYQVLFVSSRGTAGSGGDFDPNRTEADDGQDVAAWMRQQPWYTGSFATVGMSYLGYTQWALLADPPADLAAAVVVAAPHDFSRHAWGTGAFALDFVGWSDMVSTMQTTAGPRRVIRMARSRRQLQPVLDGLPLADLADAYFAGRAPWFRSWATKPDLSDPYWAPMQHAEALERAQVPVLLVGGWQDLFLRQTIQQYTRLHERGVDVALTVGPWTHLGVMLNGGPAQAREGLDWLDEHLAHRAPRRRAAPVRIFVTGAEQWRNLAAWPPATSPRTLYLDYRGSLAPQAPPDGAPLAEFTFDPARPTPTLGGPLLPGGGTVDDSALAERPDVLAFTGQPLTQDLEIAGQPSVELVHSTDNPHADLFVRISEVDPRGRSRNVTEAYTRLDLARGDGPVSVQMRPTAHRFQAGNRVRLLLAGGSHPQFGRNLGTGENPGTGATLKPSRHTIAAGSRLTLPENKAP
jgi:putative CocE/NonD family hydrolase